MNGRGIEIVSARPGDLGWCAGLHGRRYAEIAGLGLDFEAKVAVGLGDLAGRLGAPAAAILTAVDEAGAAVGSLSVDPEGWAAPRGDGLARLRFFIVDPAAQGRGIGARLLARAIEVARAGGAAGLYLTTFDGLDAARALYLRFGFALVSEAVDETWGRRLLEQRYELRWSR